MSLYIANVSNYDAVLCMLQFDVVQADDEPLLSVPARTSAEPDPNTDGKQHVLLISEEADETRTISSQSSQSSVPEHEVSVWSDEIEEQQLKRQTLNATLSTLTSRRTSPLLSTLNASWDDITAMQQSIFTKGQRICICTLSVISPGQEQEVWNAMRRDTSGADASRPKVFDTSCGLIDVLIKAFNQAESWQTKRQILSLCKWF